jgi:hypothetical protein
MVYVRHFSEQVGKPAFYNFPVAEIPILRSALCVRSISDRRSDLCHHRYIQEYKEKARAFRSECIEMLQGPSTLLLVRDIDGSMILRAP